MANRWTWTAIVLVAIASTVGGQEMPPPEVPPPGPGNAFEAPGAPPPEFCPPPAGGFPLAPPNLPDNGFTEQCPCPPPYRCLFEVGPIALRRQALGNGFLAVVDPGVDIPGIPSNVDTGDLPPEDAPAALNFNDVSPRLNWSGRVRAALLGNFGCLEFVGIHLPEHSFTARVSNAGRLDLLFAAFPQPIGFQGNNNLFLQADRIDATLELALSSAEGNWRHKVHPCFEFICGVRYLDLFERFSIRVEDDSLVTNPVDPTNIATVGSKVHNHILAPQFGLGWECELSPETIALGLTAKGAWGVNWMEGNRTLVRGDGFPGFDAPRHSTLFSHLYDVSAYMDLILCERLRFRAGYNLLWVLNVPEAHEQINFNLGQPNGQRRDHGNVLFHGPMLELVFAF